MPAGQADSLPAGIGTSSVQTQSSFHRHARRGIRRSLRLGAALPKVTMIRSQHVYEVRPRKDKRGFDLISDALPFGRLWYGGPEAAANAIGYAEHRSRSHDAVIRMYDEASKVILGVLFSSRSHQRNSRYVSAMCHPSSHHGHKPFFDCGGSFRRAQAKRECFM